MTKFSLRSVPAAMLITTALTWGLSAQAAGLGVGVDAGVGANAGAAGVSVGAQAGAGAETRASALEQNQARTGANSQGVTATSAVTDAKASGQTGIGADVSGAVSADGKAVAEGARKGGKVVQRGKDKLQGAAQLDAEAQAQGRAGSKTNK